MAKNVFRAQEVRYIDGKVQIQGPKGPEPVQDLEEVEEVQEYTGPTADDLRREAEEFRERWEEEKQRMIDEAKAEADRIVKEAEERAFEEVRQKNEEAQQTKQQADDEAKRIVEEAEAKAQSIAEEAQGKADGIEREARERGEQEGREQGFETGKTEVERLVNRLHAIIDKAIDRRNEIIEESEGQIIQLVLQIAKKVVKVISENQRNVVINNVVQALRTLKSKADVTIRVNFEDLKMTTEHTEQIIEMVERVGNVTVAEDSTVDPGGAVIETDFGHIDARISSQLREIEDRIIELSPIRSRPRAKE